MTVEVRGLAEPKNRMSELETRVFVLIALIWFDRVILIVIVIFQVWMIA
jgi:hypothetical protein